MKYYWHKIKKTIPKIFRLLNGDIPNEGNSVVLKVSYLPIMYGFITAVVVLAIAAPFVMGIVHTANTDAAIAYLEGGGYWVLAGGHCVPGVLNPCASGTTDLGSVPLQWRNLYLSGTVNSAIITNTGNINTGSISTASITDTALTAGRVPYVGAGGLITDNSRLTYDVLNNRFSAGNATLTGRLSVVTNATITGNLVAKTGRGTTYIIATSDATFIEKAQADVVLDGTNDYVEIQAANDFLTDFDSLKVIGKTIILGATGVIFNHEMFTIDMANIITNYSGIGYAYTISVPHVTGYPAIPYGNFGIILASGNAVTGANAAGLCLNGCSLSTIYAMVDNFKAGSGIVFSPSTAPIFYQVESNRFESLKIYNCKIGLNYIGNSSTAYNLFRYYQYQIDIAGITNCIGINVQTNAISYINTIDLYLIFPITTEVVSGMKGIQAEDWIINRLVVDTSGTPADGGNFLMFDTTTKLHEVKSCFFFQMNAGARLWASGEQPFVDEFYKDGIAVKSRGSLATQLLLRDNYIPLNLNVGTTLDAGGGSHAVTMDGVICSTATPAASTGGAYGQLGLSTFAGNDWDRYTELNFLVCRRYSSVNATVRFQIDTGTTFAALSSHGLGIRFDNLAMVGISRGTGGVEASVALTTVSSGQAYYVSIRFYPASRIEWWVSSTGMNYSDLVLLGTQSTAANLPSAFTNENLIYGIQTTGGILCQTTISSPYIWMERVP